MTNKEIFKQFLIRQSLVSRYIRKSQQDFLRGLKRADRELLEIAIMAVDAMKGESMITATGQQILANVRKSLEESRRLLLDPITREFLEELRLLAEDQVSFNRHTAQTTTIGQEKGINEPDEENDLFAFPIDGKTIDEWWILFFAGDSDRIMSAVNAGLIAKEDASAIFQRLRGSSELGYADGATRGSATSMATLIPTLIGGAIAFGNYTFDEANQELIQKERYTAILDSRTTMLCASLDGTVYRVGEGPYPPLHRNCRSYRVPLFEGEGEGEGGITYEEWLKQQDTETQNQVLGRTKGDLFRNGNLSIGDMLRRDGTPMRLDELFKEHGQAFKDAGITFNR